MSEMSGCCSGFSGDQFYRGKKSLTTDVTMMAKEALFCLVFFFFARYCISEIWQVWQKKLPVVKNGCQCESVNYLAKSFTQMIYTHKEFNLQTVGEKKQVPSFNQRCFLKVNKYCRCRLDLENTASQSTPKGANQYLLTQIQWKDS